MKTEIVFPDKAKMAIVCIAAVEIFALYQGINGTMLVMTVGAMAGLGGYSMGRANGATNRQGQVTVQRNEDGK